MRSALRALLTCLLVLAIPVQGVAAAARLSCDMRHSQMAESGAHDESAAHEGRGAPCPGTMAKCDACSTCAATSAAAMAPAVVPALAEAASDMRIPFLEGHRAGRLPERLERPPRTTSL